MSIVRLNELPEGSGNLTPDDIFVFMDNPSESGVTKKISLSEIINIIGSGNGESVFKIGNIDLHNGGVQQAQILQFNNNSNQSIITGPTPTTNTDAKRLIVQGQRGQGTGEGGDVYFWAGDADTNGGDIKIYAGDADNSSSGFGGYINLDAGNGFNQGGSVSVSAGNSQTQGGDVNITAGYPSGVVRISSNGGSTYWIFKNNGELFFPDGTTQTTAFSGLPNTYDAAVSWSSNHTLVDGTRYSVNDLVYQNGRLYKANYENESEPVTNTTYWTDVGAGYRLNIDGRDIPNIPYPVLSVNGQTGAVTVDVPVTSVNGQTGDVIISTSETTINTSLMQARLSLNTETISYTDILEATNLYYVPYDGNLITLYDVASGTWKYHNLSTITKNLNGINADTNYDIFVYKNNNNLDLELISWNNSAAGSSTRTSALAMQDGIYVKNNEPQKRYIGSLRATTNNMCEDSFSKRFLWNYYNKINKLCGVDYVASHTYGSSSIRAWDNNTTYGEGRSAFITGVAYALTIHYNAAISADTDENHMLSGVGLNTTSDFACGCLTVANRNSSSVRVGTSSTINIPLGFNFLQSVEYAFIGTGTFTSSRITANIFC